MAVDIVAIVTPAIAAIVGAFGGVVLSERFSRRRAAQEVRRAAYVRWLQFTQNVRWAFDDTTMQNPLQGQVTYRNRVDDIMAELELVASRRVMKHVYAFHASFDALEGPFTEVAEKHADDPQVQLDLIDHLYAQATAEARSAVIRAMRQDIGMQPHNS